MICNDEGCKINDQLECNGYFLDKDSSDSKKLIKCVSDNCVNGYESTNGYYFNSLNKDVIICDETKCENNKSYLITDCSSNNYKIIFDASANYFYCDGENEITLPSDNSVKYFVIESTLSENINYPLEFIQENTINKLLIEVSKYSIVQYTNDDGIKNNNILNYFEYTIF